MKHRVFYKRTNYHVDVVEADDATEAASKWLKDEIQARDTGEFDAEDQQGERRSILYIRNEAGQTTGWIAGR